MKPGTVRWYELDDRQFSSHHHVSSLIDLALESGIDSHKLLRQTKLFYEDLIAKPLFINGEQFCRIVENAQRWVDIPDLSFRWGHRLFPGHYDGYSKLLSHAQTLQELLDCFCESPFLTPMMRLSQWQDQHTLYLEWQPEIGLHHVQPFFIEAYTVGITSLVNWFYQQKLPWRFGFSAAYSRQPEVDQVYLGDSVQWGIGVNLIMIDRDYLTLPIEEHNRRPCSWGEYRMAIDACRLHQQRQLPGLCHVIRQGFMNDLERVPSLNELAQQLGMSSATLKRKLAKQHTSYQQLLDEAKLSASLKLMQQQAYGNNQLAEHLQVGDVNNFRKAFKRWCGLTPTALKERLDALVPN